MVVWDWDLYRFVLLRVRNQNFRRVETGKRAGGTVVMDTKLKLIKVLGCRC